jgi:anti-sigma regulatory factor (Ser/Thr protein kinase)
MYRLAAPSISTSPEVCEMLHGQQRVPVRMRERCDDQEPSPTGLPEQLLPGALLHGALRPGALLPARWGCRRISPSARDAGLACRGAREFTGQTLRGWGLLVLAEDAAVIVSELVTNALLHGCDLVGATACPVELLWWRRAGQIVCAVTDPGPEPPVLVSPEALAEAGRGLQVVQALAATWGWTRLGGRRKAVWAALSVPGADPAGVRPAGPAAPGPRGGEQAGTGSVIV